MSKECSSTTCTKESCEGCKSKEKGTGIPKEMANGYSEIKKVIGVVSGKGGVGKSFVTASLANQMAAKGYRVGIMDADITGPSIPKMYGLKGAAQADDQGIYPMITENDIKIMSVNLLLPQEDAPVIWRGPVISNMVKQFWTDVIWGELDYLFIDMPPGTGDVPLTVFQSLPIEGVVIVTSPQELVHMIVKKAYNMADMMHVPVFGVVENYSYVKCPDCGKEFKIFGESHIEEVAAELKVPFMGKMPIDTSFAEAADAGNFGKIENVYLKDAYTFLPKAIEEE
jgi:Mrp family chromosome partitioning ATPase